MSWSVNIDIVQNYTLDYRITIFITFTSYLELRNIFKFAISKMRTTQANTERKKRNMEKGSHKTITQKILETVYENLHKKGWNCINDKDQVVGIKVKVTSPKMNFWVFNANVLGIANFF